THLMHKALRDVLGDHVQQRGSLVDAEKTRFDFSHDAPLTAAQITQIEALVNREILGNAPVGVDYMAYDDAIAAGVTALFGEKYGATVRVLDIGFSRELCGGTHVQRTGDIGPFKIISEAGVASGIRRVEAITGENTLHWMQHQNQQLHSLAHQLRTVPDKLDARV